MKMVFFLLSCYKIKRINSRIDTKRQGTLLYKYTRTTKTWQLSIITWTSRWPCRGQIARPILFLRPPVRSPKCSFGGGTSPVEGERSQRCDLGLQPKNIVITILNELKAHFEMIEESVRNDSDTIHLDT